MSYILLANGKKYQIKDYAARHAFTISSGPTASEILPEMTEANLSEIRFLTESGAVTGVYRDQLMCGYTADGDRLTIRINDADLVRHGLVLDADNRILSAPAKRYAPDGAVIVDVLPDGRITDYRYVDGAYVYDPLPEPTPAESDVYDELAAAYTEGVQSA